MFKSIWRDSVLTDDQGKIEHHPDSAVCYNTLLSFNLKKSVDTNSYVITSAGGVERQELQMILTVSQINRFLDCPYWLAGPLIPDFLSKPGFTLERAEPTTVNDKRLLKIDFSYDPTNHSDQPARKAAAGAVKKPTTRIESGWLLVSPEENWVVYQEEVRFTPAGDVAKVHLLSVEYEGNLSGTPVPKRAQLKSTLRIDNDKKEMTLEGGRVLHDGDVASIDTFEFDNISFDEVPDSEFTLPAFGLPDLGSPDQLVRRDYSFVWMFLVAFFALIIAVGLKYYASRTDASPGAESTA